MLYGGARKEISYAKHAEHAEHADVEQRLEWLGLADGPLDGWRHPALVHTSCCGGLAIARWETRALRRVNASALHLERAQDAHGEGDAELSDKSPRAGYAIPAVEP